MKVVEIVTSSRVWAMSVYSLTGEHLTSDTALAHGRYSVNNMSDQ